MDHLNEVFRGAVRVEDIAVGARQVSRRIFGFRMRGKDHRIACLERKHRVAHRRHDGVGHRTDRGDHAHGLGDEHQVGVLILADDAPRRFAL